MPLERIDHYKATPRLSFCDQQTEQKYNELQLNRGRSTSIFALATLSILCLTFAFLEERILGINSVLPFYGYLGMAVIAAIMSLFSVFSGSTNQLNLRILIPGVIVICIVIATVYLNGYRIYHAIEILLLAVWLGSLNVLSFKFSTLLSILSLSVFLGVAHLSLSGSNASELKIIGLLSTMLAVLALSAYLSYMLERSRRMMFLTNEALESVYNRQESWAFTLIDMDMALSGICNFNELITRLMEQIKTTIDYDSYILTSLQGKGPKPLPDVMEGTLFEEEDKTLWPDELLTKLSQTRQATTSAEYETKKRFLGNEKKEFLHFRLDMPVMNDSTLMGVISLRRKSGPFDDLDMTASVSITAQAMMIYNRSCKVATVSETPVATPPPESKPKQEAVTKSPQKKIPVAKPKQSPDTIPDELPEEIGKETSSPSTDLDMTMDSITSTSIANSTSTSIPGSQTGSRQGRDETVVPKSLVQKIKQNEASARKTITLLSRENADQIALDRYRTAVVEGEPLSLLLVEVDGLSSIREKEGDQVAYRIFAGIVKYVFSKTDKDKDVLGRYGQNGFSILLPRVDMNAAERFAESIRVFTESALFKTPYGERQATLSVGVAAITDETGNHESMVKRADMALFVAKKNGRNCVKVRL